MGTIRVIVTIPNKTQADAESLKNALENHPQIQGQNADVQVQYSHTV